MRVAYQSDMGETMFEVNREGEETLICIANSLSQDEVYASAVIALSHAERSLFGELAFSGLGDNEVKKLGNWLAVPSLN